MTSAGAFGSVVGSRAHIRGLWSAAKTPRRGATLTALRVRYGHFDYTAVLRPEWDPTANQANSADTDCPSWDPLRGKWPPESGKWVLNRWTGVLIK
jgi:hypothetical protein